MKKPIFENEQEAIEFFEALYVPFKTGPLQLTKKAKEKGYIKKSAVEEFEKIRKIAHTGRWCYVHKNLCELSEEENVKNSEFNMGLLNMLSLAEKAIEELKAQLEEASK